MEQEPDDSRDTSGYKGIQSHIPGLVIASPIKKTEYVFTGQPETVRYFTDELTALCPKTALPDFYALEIEYVPDKWLIELKSLKLYLIEYRNIGIFHEHLARKIYNDIREAVSPKKLRITLKARVRGGISAEIIIED